MKTLSSEDIAALPLTVSTRGEARSLVTREKADPVPDGKLAREEFALVWDAFVSQFPPDVVVYHTPESVISSGGFGRDEVLRYLKREPETFAADVADIAEVTTKET